MLLMGIDLFYFQFHGLLRHIPDAGFARDQEQFSGKMMDIILNGMLVPEEAGRVE